MVISLPSLESENTDFVTRADRPHGMNIPWLHLVTCLVTEMQYETMRLGDGRSEPNMVYGLADRKWANAQQIGSSSFNQAAAIISDCELSRMFLLHSSNLQRMTLVWYTQNRIGYRQTKPSSLRQILWQFLQSYQSEQEVLAVLQSKQS